MWTPCPTVVDEPVTILGLELEDVGVVAVALLVASLALNALESFVAAAAVGVGLYWSKRGKAPGAFLHTLHRAELVPIPGVLGPRPQRYAPW